MWSLFMYYPVYLFNKVPCGNQYDIYVAFLIVQIIILDMPRGQYKIKTCGNQFDIIVVFSYCSDIRLGYAKRLV